MLNLMSEKRTSCISDMQVSLLRRVIHTSKYYFAKCDDTITTIHDIVRTKLSSPEPTNAILRSYSVNSISIELRGWWCGSRADLKKSPLCRRPASLQWMARHSCSWFVGELQSKRVATNYCLERNVACFIASYVDFSCQCHTSPK